MKLRLPWACCVLGVLLCSCDGSVPETDSDGDGLPDRVEELRGTNPLRWDSDADALSDLTEQQQGTDPLKADSDVDGFLDGEEVMMGDNPLSDRSLFVEDLGNPALRRWPKQPYPRNVWDLQSYRGKIFLGSGNSSNLGPSPNAGPAPIISFDPGLEYFSKELLTDDEQVDRFRVIEGTLWVPGHDPKESWSLGNLYRRGLASWEKLRTLPKAIHTYDLAFHEDRLWAALGSNQSRIVASSIDSGVTWNTYALPKVTMDKKRPMRVYHLFRLQGQLYAFSQPTFNFGKVTRRRGISPERNSSSLYRWDDAGFVAVSPSFIDRLGDDLQQRFGTFWQARIKTHRAVELGSYLYLLLGEVWNDHQFMPLYLLRVGNERDASKIDLRPGEVPWDIWSDGKKLLVLCARRQEAGGYVISVKIQHHGESRMRELVHFTEETFARAFEVLDGDLYFGLGTEVQDPQLAFKMRQKGKSGYAVAQRVWADELSERSGQILRLRGWYLLEPI